MNDQEFYKMRVDEAKRLLSNYISVFIENHAKVVTVTTALKKLEEIKKPTEQEQQDKKTYESHIEAYKERANNAQLQVDTFRLLVDIYSKNEPVKL